MTDRKEVLFLSHRIPFPPDKGDKIRSWRLLHALLERFDVHLACFIDDKEDLAYRSFLEKRCASTTFVEINPRLQRIASAVGLIKGSALTFEYFGSMKMQRAIATLRNRPLVAEIVFSSAMAPYIETPMGERKRIVDFCDADSEKWRQYAQNSGSLVKWVYAREGEMLARAENKIVQWADASFAVTEEEAALFNARRTNDRQVDWWSNGVDIEYFDPSAPIETATRHSDVVFTGAMDYRANVEAVTSFVKDVWPLIRKEKSSAQFSIVGARPASEIKTLNGRDGITVTGRVDDVRPWLQNARVSVAPMRVARGIQNKVLEAMSMAKPVVGSSAAFEGIGPDTTAARKADNASDMAKAILHLLDNKAEADALGREAREFVVQHYGWDQRLQRFTQTLSKLGL